jgi:cyclophilin family peptidyl-prolyl cis-trans isomerase
MAKEQQKRRRKRRVVESAYAGDVKPSGVFGLFTSRRVIQAFFVIMALAIVGGLVAGALSAGAFGGSGAPKPDPTFVVPEDGTSVQATATVERQVFDEAPPLTIDPGKTYTATVQTEAGDFEIELLAADATETVNNFVFLAREGFYEGLAFFFVDPGFSAQAGDPRCTSATDSPQNCSGDAGYELAQEAPGPFVTGNVGMVNSSQFFVALTDSEQFEQFTPFGRVTSGLDIVDQIAAGTKITGIEVQEE